MKKQILSVAVSSVLITGIYNIPVLAADTPTETSSTTGTVTYPITTKLSDVAGKYVGSYKVNNGGSTPYIYILSDQRANVDSTSAQLQGSVTDPLTKAQYDAMKAAGTFKDDSNGNNLTSNINAIANGYAFNQGDNVDIDLNSRFVLSDEAAADGWAIKSITPVNLSGGLSYDRTTGHITGKIVEDVETGARDMRTDIVLSKAGESDLTYQLRNYVVGAVIWKDTTAPTITQDDQTFSVGDAVSFDLGISDNSFNKAFEKNTLKYNDDFHLSNTDTTIYGANIGNQQMGIYVTGLPDGMTYDSKTGKVSGKASMAGIYNVS